MCDLPDGGGSVPHEEAVHVEPVRLLPVEEGGLHHRRQPEVALRHVKYYLLACMMDGVRYLGNVRLACFALGAAGLGVLGPVREIIGVVTHPQPGVPRVTDLSSRFCLQREDPVTCHACHGLTGAGKQGIVMVLFLFEAGAGRICVARKSQHINTISFPLQPVASIRLYIF